MQKIEIITAFVASDATGEGIMGLHTPEGWMPMIGADQDRLESLYPMAKRLAEQSGKEMRILRFSGREDITEQLKLKYET